LRGGEERSRNRLRNRAIGELDEAAALPDVAQIAFHRGR
jgi:hypothetical protein